MTQTSTNSSEFFNDLEDILEDAVTQDTVKVRHFKVMIDMLSVTFTLKISNFLPSYELECLIYVERIASLIYTYSFIFVLHNLMLESLEIDISILHHQCFNLPIKLLGLNSYVIIIHINTFYRSMYIKTMDTDPSFFPSF